MEKPTGDLVSILIPVFNEAENAAALHDEIDEALEQIQPRKYEVIWVDDHSTDETYELLKRLTKDQSNHRVFRLSRNMGQTQALAAALSKARGEFIVTIDGDLQNPPYEIPRLVKELDNNWDVVSGWRRARRDNFFGRRLPSRIGNWVVSRALGFRVRDYGCSLRVYRRRFLRNIQFVGDTHRFLLAYAVFNGARFKEIPVDHRPRNAGKSKYGWSRIIKVLIDIVVMRFFAKYSTRPAHFFGYYGALLMLVASLLSAWVVVRYFLGGAWMSPLLVIAIVAFFGGANVIFFGLGLDILYRLFLTQTGGSLFMIDESDDDSP